MTTPENHLQNHLHVIRVPLALLVPSELGAAVKKRSNDAGLVGVDRGRGNKRGRGRKGHGDVAVVSCGDRHGCRIAGLSLTAVSGRPCDKSWKGSHGEHG